jgi:hypothetical protein
MPASRARGLTAVAGLALVAGAFTVTKAVHMDDTAHLWIARAIARDPLHAAQAMFNWDQVPEPLHALNVPHLFMYLLAVPMKLGAPTEALHLVSVAFAFLALWLFWKLAGLLVPAQAVWVTALLALGPAFLPGLNLMVDVPTLAVWAGFFLCMALAGREGGQLRDWQACAFAAAGCLIKYTSLVLLPAFVVLAVRRKAWKSLLALSVPVATLVAWSAFNWIAYGQIHLFERAGAVASPDGAVLTAVGLAAGRLPMWILGLGALSPFAVGFALQAGRRVLWICAGAGAAIAAAGLLLPLGDLREFRDVNATDAVLRGIFFANGLLVASLIRKALLARRNGGSPEERSEIDVLVVWMGCAIAAAVLLAPFPAARHVLLALPPVLVLLARDFAPPPRRAAGALALTAALGVAAAVSDWRRADVYRTEARALSSAGTAWTVGHWGWQWYATQEGMREYEPGKSRFQPGELVVVPGTIHQQRFTAEDSALLHLVREESVPGNALDLVRTVTGAGGLYYYWAAVPWTLRWGAVEKFRIYEVRPARSSDLDGLATEGKRRSVD